MRRAWLALLFLLVAAPAWAVKEWYEHYLLATERLIPAGRYAEAIKELQAAVKLKPAPATDAQTYGLEFINYYLPYYHLGLCHLRTGDYGAAIRLFDLEESREAIKKSPLHRELVRLRGEAENAERQRLAQRARQEVNRLLREGAELARARKFDEALKRLVQAEAIAKSLDPGTQRIVSEARERIRADQQDLEDAAARADRIGQDLAEGTRLLEEGKGTDAMVRFDAVLALDPRNAQALEGRKAAQERILALTTRQERVGKFKAGKALFDAGQYEQALAPLTDAAAEPSNAEARELLEKARKVVEGLRQQKELRARIEALFGQGEHLLGAGKFPDAQVAFEGVLRLDPGNARAQERLGLAERRTGEAILAKWLPNWPPSLSFFEPKAREIEGPRVSVVGVATDDRGITKVEFRQGGQVVDELLAPPRLDTGEGPRNLPFQREFPLQPGSNEISVTAVDETGLPRTETFLIVRRLRFYETRAFLPSAFAAAVGLIGAGLGAQKARRRRALRRRFNPYIAGAPVIDEDMFFGRQKLMARMMNVLHHNSLMITGERRIGKTTFLLHLERRLAQDDGTDYRFYPVLTDLQGVPETGFFHALMTDVVETLDLDAEKRSRLRFRSDHEDYDGRDFSHDLQRVIEELKTRTPKRVKLALLIDEVDVLNEYSEQVNQRLRSIFMKTFSENLVAIMSGVGIKRIWKSEVSPWYNFFDEVELAAFSREEGEALIREPVGGVFRYEPPAVDRILELSQLKPYLIQKLCINAVNRMLEEGRTTIRLVDVEAVRNVVLLDGAGVPGSAERASRQASA